MPEPALEVNITAIVHHPGHFTLTCGSVMYPIEFRPEMDVTLGDLLRRLRPILVGGSDPSEQLTPLALLREIGIRLWRALLPDTAPSGMCEVLVRDLRVGITPLLLTLPKNLAILPWELLCDPERPDDTGFLARQRPLVRLVSGGTDLPPLAPPLRVLLLISSRPGLDERQRVDVESERAAVENATRTFREAGLMHLLVEDIVTLKRVQQTLLRFKPHILHYVGHGTYNEDLGGFLVWEDDVGNPVDVSDARLADLLRPRGLRAVLLHSCETAHSDSCTDFRSLAGTLLGAGIPAVLAQQASFTDESSQRASEIFYTALTSGLRLAEATFEARQALAQADHPDWAVPTLQATESGLLPLLDQESSPGPPDPTLEPGGAAANLPTPTGVFVGRQRELRALRTMLESAPGSGPVLALISGPAGVGKSTLAAQAVTHYGIRYKAALTLSCVGYQSMDLFLQRIGGFLQRQGMSKFLNHILPDPKLSIAAKIEEAIAALNTAGPFLLVVDNLESVQREDRTLADADLLELLQKLLTNLRGGRVLITGRYAVEGLLPDGKFAASLLRIVLDDLSTYEIQRLLAHHPTLAHLDETVREELVREFGGLPYVYDLLSSQAAGQNLSALVHDVQGRITREREQRAATEWEAIRQQVVESAALEATVARLPLQVRTLLARISVLRRPFPLQALEQGLSATRLDWQPLLDWALLHYNPAEGDYRLHSLTARYAEGLLETSDRRQTQIQVAAWYLCYANNESHNLVDYLEAHRLFQAADEAERAGQLVMSLAEVLRHVGLYHLLSELCRETMSSTQGVLAAQAQYKLGNIAFLQGQYEEARQLYQEVLTSFERLGDQAGRAGTLHQLGMIAQEQGRYEEAWWLYQESLLIKERLGDQAGRASTLHQLGNIAFLQGQYEEAQQLYQEVLTSFERLGDQAGRAGTLHQSGNIAYLQGQHEEARRLYQESLLIKKRLGDQAGRASTLHQLGMIAQSQGQYEEAQRLYQEALAIFERLGDQAGRADTLHQLGNIAQSQGQYEEARQLYQEALIISKRLGDQRGRASTLHQLGVITQDQGQYEEARQLYQESLLIKERLGDQAGRASTLHQLGVIAQDQGQYEEARQLYQESLLIKELLGDQAGRASTLGQLGLLARQQGDTSGALRYTMQALLLFERLRSPYYRLASGTMVQLRAEVGEEVFMTVWQEVSGGRPVPENDADEQTLSLLQRLIAFIQARTWNESQQLLEADQALMSREANALLEQLATEQQEANVQRLIEQYRVLLARCREVGITAAFAELIRQGEQNGDTTQ